MLKEIVYGYNRNNSDVYTCFIDVSKAFDTVNHGLLMKCLRNLHIPEGIIKLIEYWYNNQYVSVRFNGTLSDEWKIKNGVRQGGILSELFFSLYINDVINKVNKQNIGCKMGIINCILIAYADDMVIMSPSYKGLQMLLNIVYNELDSIGLKINTNKTKCMIFRSKKKVDQYDIKPFNINGNDIFL